jgi:hypothetical protein
MDNRTKLIHLGVGFAACAALVVLALVSKRWEISPGAQATVSAFLGLVLWNVRSVLFRSSPEEPPPTPKNDKPEGPAQ